MSTLASDELNKLIGDALKGILRLLQVHIDQDTGKYFFSM